MKYAFSYDLIDSNPSTFANLIRSLTDDGNTCFVLINFYVNTDTIVATLNQLELKVNTFMCPHKPHDSQAAVAWKANTVKSIAAALYMDSDQAAVEQARLLGVPSAHYRI